jgi:hypothetical protein
MAGVDESNVETLTLINTEVSGRLARQDAAGSQIDTKAAFLAGIAAAATQFLAGRKDPVPVAVFAYWAYVFYAASFLCAVGAYALARYQDVPEPCDFIDEFALAPKALALANLVATKSETFEQNKRKFRRKVWFWWSGVGTLAMGLLLSGIAIGNVLAVAPPSAPPEQCAPAVPGKLAPPTSEKVPAKPTVESHH